MKNKLLNNVKLLIVDLDGVIFDCTDFNFVAINESLKELGISGFIPKDIMRGKQGEPSEKYYKGILPEELHDRWEIIRTKNRQQYDKFIASNIVLFPMAKDILVLLKSAGYKLALYCNSSTEYFDAVLSLTDLGAFFDYAECVGKCKLTKKELAEKIIKHFVSPGTAIIGDRDIDIDIARDLKCISIGATFGYGNVSRADIKINSLEELKNLFGLCQ